ISAFLPGTVLGVHFASQIGAPRDAITFGVAWAIVSTGGLILYLAYREHAATAEESHLKNDDVVTVNRDRAKREILAGIPLAIGSVCAAYFMFIAELAPAVSSAAVGLACWIVLRRLLVSDRS